MKLGLYIYSLEPHKLLSFVTLLLHVMLLGNELK